MDHVLNLLAVSYNPGQAKADQTAATEAIDQALASAPLASLTVLLQIATEATTESGAAIDDTLRFVAISRIKNFFKFDWSEAHSNAIRGDANFAAFQSRLLAAVAQFTGDQHTAIRRQLHEAIRVLIPETKWNYYEVIAPQLRAAAAITPETVPQGTDVMANTLTLVELAVSLTRNFKFQFSYAICSAVSRDLLSVLPPLLTLWRTLGTPQLSPANLHMLHQIMKIFEDCCDVLLDSTRLNATKSQHQDKHGAEAGAVEKVGEDAALGALIVNWLEFMVTYPQEYLAAFMAATGNDVSKVVGNSRGYLSFVRTVKRIGLIAFGLAEDASRNAPLDVKASRKKASAGGTVTTKGNRKIYHAPKAAEEDNSSWLTQKCWVAGSLPLRFAQMWLQWLQWATQQANSPALGAESDVLGAQRKASMQAIRFIKMGITSESLYAEVIIPHFMEIIGLLIGSLCYNEEDEERYAEHSEGDLQDFCIMLEEDSYMMNEFTLRQASSNCIVAFAVASKSFHDPNLIFRILEALNGALAGGVDANGNEVSGTPNLTYGYLHMLGHLKAQIRKRDELWKGAMEGALLTHVIPRINSAHLFLRVKALQVLGRYARVPVSSDNLGNFIAGVGALLNDKDARIRLAAIDAMCAFLALASARPYLKLVLLPLVNECMALMDRVRCSFIPSALQYLCESYGVELIPVIARLAATVSQQLCAALFEVQQEINAEVIDESEKAQQQSEQNGISIIANCDALYHLTLACEHNIPLLNSIIPDILRPFQLIFANEELFDFVEKATETLMHVLYLTKPIAPELWAFFPHIHNLVMNHFQGVDTFADLASCVDNYLSNSPAEFVANAEAMRMTLEMCRKMIIDVSASHHQKEKAAAVQLLSSIFHQCRLVCFDGVIAYMPQILQITMQGLQSKGNAKSDKLKSTLVANILDAFWFSPTHAAQVLEGAGATVFMLQTIATTFPPMIKNLSILRRKQFILGLTSLLEAYSTSGAAVIPSLAALSQAEQTAILGPLLNIVVACIVANTKNYTTRCRRLEKGLAEEGFKDIEEFADGDFDVDDEDLDEDFDGDDSDEDDGEAEDGDDIDYSSPIDEICEVQFFLNFAAKADPALLQLVTVATMTDVNASLETSTTFMRLCKEMEAKEKAVHDARAAELH